MTTQFDLISAGSGSLVEALATAVVVVDDRLQVETVNAAAESLLALSAAKLVGRGLEDAFADGSELAALIGRVLEDPRTFTERDLELVLQNVQTIVVDCTVSPWISRENEEFRVIIELASVERHQRIQLEESMLVQNQVTTALMRGLAHEVKNPLGGIRGAAQLLERKLEDQAQAEYTQIIIGEADRLRALVDSMLGPPEAPRKELVNIHEVLEHVAQLVSVEYTCAVRIVRDYDPSLPEFAGDRDQLVQAFLNLVRNAARAIDGTGEIRLRTRAQRKFNIGENVHRLVARIDVIDTGPGVPAEISETIFYPMVSGHADGTGLGLPLAQSIVNRQGGLINFNSEPGHTEFSVWLPLGAGR
ncbi:MAG: nitrogen regulation protein NR(II) [Gammaproteobacteria bacterium]|jgi:two-component system nitrogen regulation sensor histidine kinase GlnL